MLFYSPMASQLLISSGVGSSSVGMVIFQWCVSLCRSTRKVLSHLDLRFSSLLRMVILCSSSGAFLIRNIVS